MDKVTLSICIATRNRGAFIGETLDSILCQATHGVEIVIVDGASTDNTAEVVRSYNARFPRLLYFRQETNMGIDRDFTKAVDLAHGEYCWLFCDDDVIKPGSIGIVLEAIQNDYALILANSEVRNADLSRVLEHRRLPFRTDRVYRPSENHLLLHDTGSYLSFIGSVIIKRQIWNDREKVKYFGSYFIHVGIIFQRPLSGDTLVIADPLVCIRYENASWTGKYFEIWMFKWPGLVWSFVDLPDSAKRRVCPKEPWRSLRTLLHLRAKGRYGKKEYVEWLQPRVGGSKWGKFVSYVSARFPGRVANLLLFIYFAIFRYPSDRLLVLSDLANSPFCFWRRRSGRSTKIKNGRVIVKSQFPSSTGKGNEKPLDSRCAEP
jgi:abequosyltransferase